MAGNKAGAAKARDTLLAKNPNHFKEIGKNGGSKGTDKGGFKYMKEHEPERFAEIVSNGGKKSKKTKKGA